MADTQMLTNNAVVEASQLELHELDERDLKLETILATIYTHLQELWHHRVREGFTGVQLDEDNVIDFLNGSTGDDYGVIVVLSVDDGVIVIPSHDEEA